MDLHAATPPEFRYDVFISYSRKDTEFARQLERELRRYRPPADLPVPQRYLRVFRDETDLTGGEYHDSLDRNLRDASKLIVICSPHSAASNYVADEIRRFAQYRGKEHIVPILLDGVPNNEAQVEDVGRQAFPDELVRLLPIPLAADYRGFAAKADKLRKGRFATSWFKTLADLYGDYGVDRSKIEQRERRREARRLRTIAAASSAIALALIGLTIWALLSRNEARRQRDSAEARRNEAEARLVFDDSGEALVKATLLAVASVRFARTVDGQISLTRFASLLPRPPLWRQSLGPSKEAGPGGRHKVLAYSPDGTRIASAGGSGPIQLLDARTGKPLSLVSFNRIPADRTVIAFSPNGSLLVVGCAHEACVVDAASGQLLTRLPQGGRHGKMVWSASFSPDGGHLALASYGSNDVVIYDVATWKAATIRQASNAFSVAFSPDGQYLATVTPPGLQLWRVGSYEAPVAHANTGIVWSIAFQSDSIVVAADRGLQAWNIASNSDGAIQLEAATSIPIKAHTVLPVQWLDRPCFAAAASDAVHLLCDESLAEVLRIPTSSVAAALSPDTHSLLNERSDGTLEVWSLDAGVDVFRIPLGSPIKSIATPEQKNWLAAGTESGEVLVVGVDTWKELTRLRLETPVSMISASSNGQWLIVCADHSLRVFDASTWGEVASKRYEDPIVWAGFESGDRSIAVMAGATVVVLQTGDWSERLRVKHDGSIRAIKFSPDGGSVATTTHWNAGHDAGVSLTRVFDLASGKETAWEYSSPGGSSISESFMQEEAARNKRALAGGDALSIKEAALSWRPMELEEPRERISADETWNVEATGSELKLTDVAAKRPIGSLGQTAPINTVHFVPAHAPRWVVSGGADNTLRIWPVRAEDLAQEACGRLMGILGAERLETLTVEMGAERNCR